MCDSGVAFPFSICEENLVITNQTELNQYLTSTVPNAIHNKTNPCYFLGRVGQSCPEICVREWCTPSLKTLLSDGSEVVATRPLQYPLVIDGTVSMNDTETQTIINNYYGSQLITVDGIAGSELVGAALKDPCDNKCDLYVQSNVIYLTMGDGGVVVYDTIQNQPIEIKASDPIIFGDFAFTPNGNLYGIFLETDTSANPTPPGNNDLRIFNVDSETGNRTLAYQRFSGMDYFIQTVANSLAGDSSGRLYWGAGWPQTDNVPALTPAPGPPNWLGRIYRMNAATGTGQTTWVTLPVTTLSATVRRYSAFKGDFIFLDDRVYAFTHDVSQNINLPGAIRPGSYLQRINRNVAGNATTIVESGPILEPPGYLIDGFGLTVDANGIFYVSATSLTNPSQGGLFTFDPEDLSIVPQLVATFDSLIFGMTSLYEMT